jgi:small multidrug resistance family-3 protein
VDGVRPHLWDLVGVAVTLLGMGIIMFAPRPG